MKIFFKMFLGVAMLCCSVVTVSAKTFTKEDYKAMGSPDNLVIPEGYTEIGEKALQDCGVRSVKMPSTVTIIGESAFAHCRSLKSVHIPDSVTEIGDSAFRWCADLPSINIPNSVTKIGSGAFAECHDFSFIYIPNSVTEIGYGAFFYCKKLLYVEIPDSVTRIENGVFWGCWSLECVVVPDSVTAIYDNAFEQCNDNIYIVVRNRQYKYSGKLRVIMSQAWLAEIMNLPTVIKSDGEAPLSSLMNGLYDRSLMQRINERVSIAFYAILMLILG